MASHSRCAAVSRGSWRANGPDWTQWIGKNDTLASDCWNQPARRGHDPYRRHQHCASARSSRDRFRADKLGYVFQTFNLLPGFTALENVLLGMSFATGRASRTEQGICWTRRLGATPAAQTGATFCRRTTARGRRGRWRTSRSCCWQTNQRPTSTRDTRQQVVDLIRETCREENVALVLVTHTPEVAKQFDRVENLENINLVCADQQNSNIECRPPRLRIIVNHVNFSILYG